MNELTELYREVILDHNKEPHNFRDIVNATHQADGFNPLCGDCVTVQLLVEEGRVADVAFKGSGCAMSIASASLMTDALKGKTVEEARQTFDALTAAVTGGATLPPENPLAALEGVREFPMRVKCVTLVWHTMKSALDGARE